MFTNAINQFWSLVMANLTDVDGFKIYIQVRVAWLPTPECWAANSQWGMTVYILLLSTWLWRQFCKELP